jgi:ABC-2 type transport system permease protein
MPHPVDNFRRNLRVWSIYAQNCFSQTLSHRFIVVIFVAAKLLRIFLFLIFLWFLFKGTSSLGGYRRDQIIFFYLAFQLIDTTAQFFFRAVYNFRSLVISGDLDLVLIKPIDPLTRVLWGGPDVLDLITLVPMYVATIWFAVVTLHPSPVNWLGFIILSINSLIIAAALHVVVLGLGVITLSVDHFVLIYRDFTSLMRIPVDLYVEPVRSFLTFIIPVGLMMTFPARMLMGLLSPLWIGVSLLFAVVALIFALRFWRFCLTRYQSTGS